MAQLAVRLSALVLILFVATPAAAQDDPRFALLASFPSPTISFQWELSERFALRVDGSYAFSDESFTETSPGDLPTSSFPTVIAASPTLEARSDATSHTGTIGLAGIYTFHRSEQLRLYLAPRVSMGFTTQSVTISVTATNVPPGFPPRLLDGLVGTQSYDFSSKSPGAGLSFGAATNVHTRLALFGEAGFNYVRTNSPDTTFIGVVSPAEFADSRRTTLNTRAVGGVMFRF